MRRILVSKLESINWNKWLGDAAAGETTAEENNFPRLTSSFLVVFYSFSHTWWDNPRVFLILLLLLNSFTCQSLLRHRPPQVLISDVCFHILIPCSKPFPPFYVPSPFVVCLFCQKDSTSSSSTFSSSRLNTHVLKFLFLSFHRIHSPAVCYCCILRAEKQVFLNPKKKQGEDTGIISLGPRDTTLYSLFRVLTSTSKLFFVSFPLRKEEKRTRNVEFLNINET